MPNKRLKPEQRAEQKRRYYSKHRLFSFNSGLKLTLPELKLIKEHRIPDADLSRVLQRSVQAIQAARHKIKNNKYSVL
jgi:hypothetical protein